MKPKAIESTVESLLKKRHVVICVGAGGVGKTTLAAAMAVKAARGGRRVVCLTIDPARRLADSLGVSSEEKTGKIKDITSILGNDMQSGGSLSFGMLDPKETFARIILERASSQAAARRILNNKLYRYVSGSLSGMQEYMALEQLLTIRNDDEVDLIVLDTPPTSNAIDFFTAPSRMTEALDGRLVRIMRRAYKGPARSGFDLWGRWTAILLKAISRFTGIELLNEMMAFVDALSDLFGSFAERARAIEKILHDSEVAFCLISTADKSTLRETRDFKDRLKTLGLHVDAVIFNRAHWPQAQDPPKHLGSSELSEVLSINEKWNESFFREEALIGRVHKAWSGKSVIIRVPVLPDEATRVDSLDRLGRFL